MIQCSNCKSSNIIKQGFRQLKDKEPKQRYKCKDCGSKAIEESTKANNPDMYYEEVKRTTDFLPFIKHQIKHIINVTGEYTATNKANLADILVYRYELPIGYCNRAINRVLRTNGHRVP